MLMIVETTSGKWEFILVFFSTFLCFNILIIKSIFKNICTLGCVGDKPRWGKISGKKIQSTCFYHTVGVNPVSFSYSQILHLAVSLVEP